MKGYAENKYVNTDRMFSEITIYHNLTPQVLESVNWVIQL